MAVLYYVRDGRRPYTTPHDGRYIDLLQLDQIVHQGGVVYHYVGEEPPEFHATNPSIELRRVVVEVVPKDSLTTIFSKAGFYFFPDLTTQKAEAVFASSIGEQRYP